MRAQTVDTLFAPSFDKRDMGKKKIYIFVQDLFSFSLNSKDKKIFQKKMQLILSHANTDRTNCKTSIFQYLFFISHPGG